MRNQVPDETSAQGGPQVTPHSEESKDAEQDPRSKALHDIKGHPGGLGQAGTAEPRPETAGSEGGGIDGAVGGGQSGQGGG